MTTRTEKDSFGPIEVPASRLWGAQTQRSLHFFRVSDETMPRELISALVQVKKAAATVNVTLAGLDPKKSEAICRAADEVLGGQHAGEFPLSVWQTGSGTQTNMNVNEVLANRASELLGGRAAKRAWCTPTTTSTGASRATTSSPPRCTSRPSRPHPAGAAALQALAQTAATRAVAFKDLVKLGRTHLQDATPMTLGQEFFRLRQPAPARPAPPRGRAPAPGRARARGTAVGTGLKRARRATPSRWPGRSPPSPTCPCAPRTTSSRPSPPATRSSTRTARLKGLAVSLFKFASDLRLLGSGPRAGLGELLLPENEPGSSIMPGKVNPTQAEMLTMVCVQVMANDAAVSLGGANGHLELNVFRPLVIHAFLQSCRLLADGMDSFREHCVAGLQPNVPRITQHVQESLMLVTALAPHLGYEKAAQIASRAHREGTSLRPRPWPPASSMRPSSTRG